MMRATGTCSRKSDCHCRSDRVRRISLERVSIKSHSRAMAVQLTNQYYFTVIMTPIVIICALTVLLFGFESKSRNEPNRFGR
jgi:hypothetical protein